jgi:ABC-type sugar transport system substrate-binding protein
MSDTRHEAHGRGRIALAGAVLAVALPVAALMSGVGFAKDSISSSAYGQYGKKVTICHHTHSKKHPWVTITVSSSALAAHKKHGDDLTGPCPASAAKVKAAKAKADKAKHHGKPSTPPGNSSAPNPGQGHGNGKGKGK